MVRIIIYNQFSSCSTHRQIYWSIFISDRIWLWTTYLSWPTTLCQDPCTSCWELQPGTSKSNDRVYERDMRLCLSINEKSQAWLKKKQTSIAARLIWILKTMHEYLPKTEKLTDQLDFLMTESYRILEKIEHSFKFDLFSYQSLSYIFIRLMNSHLLLKSTARMNEK